MDKGNERSAFRRTDVADHQLDGVKAVGMFGLLDSIAYVDGLMCVDMLEIRSHVESYGIDHAACAVVFKFKFDVLEILADQFACAKIKDVTRTEHRILVARAKWVEFLKIRHKFRSYVGEFYHGVDLDHWRKLVGLYMRRHIFLETPTELGDILLF